MYALFQYDLENCELNVIGYYNDYPTKEEIKYDLEEELDFSYYEEEQENEKWKMANSIWEDRKYFDEPGVMYHILELNIR